MSSPLHDLLEPALFKALCDPRRVALVTQLAACREATVSELAKVCPCDLSVVSRHLATLRDAGVIDATRRGRNVYYRLSAKRLATTLRQIADALDAGCCG